MYNYIGEIKFDQEFNMYAKFEKGKSWHKIKILNAPNICGMYFKIHKRIITERNITKEDFTYILEKLLNIPIGSETYERIKKQLNNLGYDIYSSVDKRIIKVNFLN